MRDDLFDEAARILASPVPRRRALKLLRGALVASIFGTFGSTHLAAQAACSPACLSGEKCCLTDPDRVPFCVPQARTCCGPVGCTVNQTCCAGVVCCAARTTCCGNWACCPAGQRCSALGVCEASQA